ncbi:hypothetical protein LCGC14_0740490 [marine sediment metagenome]|uniref:Uncharacterized protein n=1 Tax=marine sediment metagenome TaxID=412755 RepID=A0A0F9Q6W7_9ZZZZ
MEEQALADYADPTGEESLMSRIPLMMGDNKKMAYLSFRATGFPVHQAADLAEVKIETVRGWRKRDKQFRDIEVNRLAELQSTVARDVIRSEFMRNMRLLTLIDAKVINRAMILRKHDMMLEGLSSREYEWMKSVRKHYDPSAFAQLEKALDPEAGADKLEITIKLGWGEEGEIVEGNFIDPSTSISHEVA